jgi:BirA family biotin operon repressor/biotin-[acetyl-CoA-carboxylase] ligase
VNHSVFPPPLDLSATSLCIETEYPVDRNALAAALLASIDESYHLVANDFPRIIEWANRADCLRGRQIVAEAGAVIQRGVAEGLATDGALLLRMPDGALQRLTSGEVTHFSAGIPAPGCG